MFYSVRLSCKESSPFYRRVVMLLYLQKGKQESLWQDQVLLLDITVKVQLEKCTFFQSEIAFCKRTGSGKFCS